MKKWKHKPTVNWVLLVMSKGLTTLTVIQNQPVAQILPGTPTELLFF